MPIWARALGVTLLMQVTAVLATQALPVLGPLVTDAARVPPERIGYLSAISTVGSMWFLMSGGPLLVRHGPVRMLQLGGLVCAAGLALALSGEWSMIVLAALLSGVGYGPTPPSGSDILNRTAPAAHRTLIFSVKQSGAPLGGALAGLIVPAVAALGGWRAGILAGAAIVALSALAIQPARATLDADRDRAAPVSWRWMLSPARLLEPARALRLAPGLPVVTYAGFAFAFAQGSVHSLYVTYLVADHGFDIEFAGLAFAIMLGVGVASRILVGWLADRAGGARRVLLMLAAGSSAATALIAAIGPGWSWNAVLATGIAAGFVVASWNGLYLAEVARLAPPGKVGEATAGSTFFCFTGYVIGPALAAWLIGLTGSYALAFLVAAALPLTAGAALARHRSGPQHAGE